LWIQIHFDMDQNYQQTNTAKQFGQCKQMWKVNPNEYTVSKDEIIYNLFVLSNHTQQHPIEYSWYVIEAFSLNLNFKYSI